MVFYKESKRVTEKTELLKAMVSALEEELKAVLKSAHSAYQGATHEDAISKSKYETHGLELSYLAGSQFERARILKQQILSLTNTQFKFFKDSDEIGVEALVSLSSAKKIENHYFIYGIGAGLKLKIQDKTVQVVSPESVIGNDLIGAFCNDTILIERASQVEEWEVVSVC